MDNLLPQFFMIIILSIFFLKYGNRARNGKAEHIIDLPSDRIKPKSLSSENNKELDFDYKKKQYLLTKSEHDFFNTLSQVIENQLYIFPQVHLSDLFEHKIYGQNWRGALNHIQRKSVDFVICDKEYLKPLCAIELDDSSHNTQDRADRDETVEEIFKNANLPLIRIKNTGTWDKELIKEYILKAIK